MKNRITYQTKDAIIVFRLGKTSNKKIASSDEKILQSYSFAKDQFEYVKNCVESNEKINPSQFFNLASKVRFDCPFKSYGKCYTHKYMQFSGFVSMLKSIHNEFLTTQIPTLEDVRYQIKDLARNVFVRFGTYGEPTLIDKDLVQLITIYAKNWTGYTHQWMKQPEYSPYFMASVHSENTAKIATSKGYISFIASPTQYTPKVAVICPASKEAGFVSNCSKCGLCSGMNGKGNKNVQILEH